MIFINTRSSELTEALRDQGHTVIEQPLLEIEMYPKQDYYEQLVAYLPKADKLIFVSPNAVHASLETLQSIWQTRKQSMQIFAVGPKTATVLKSALNCSVLVPSDHFSSEALLALPAFENIKNETIVLISSPGGRAVLQSNLRERAVILHEVHVYSRKMPGKCEALPFSKRCILVCTSAEAMKNFFDLYPDARHHSENQLEWLVSSKRLKQLAVDHYQVIPNRIHLAENASEQALLVAAKEWL